MSSVKEAIELLADIDYLHSQGVVIYRAGHREFNFDDETFELLIEDKDEDLYLV